MRAMLVFGLALGAFDSLDNLFCNCEWGGTLRDGCRISRPAPEGLACLCTYTVGVHIRGYKPYCHAEVTTCADQESGLCKQPDSTIHSCHQAIGVQKNCAGYDRSADKSCDCGYREGKGCVLTKKPPAHQACRCSRNTNTYSCDGDLIPCPESNGCRKPSLQRSSCHGNCDGYTDDYIPSNDRYPGDRKSSESDWEWDGSEDDIEPEPSAIEIRSTPETQDEFLQQMEVKQFPPFPSPSKKPQFHRDVDDSTEHRI